jgi:integrase
MQGDTMSVRKRIWKTAAGEERQAWLCDYTGQSGKRHIKTFARKKDADAFIAKAKVEVDIPSRDEIRAIVAALQGPWRPILLTAIFTGLRASELRGLRWAHVDLKASELHVRQRADRYNAIGARRSRRPGSGRFHCRRSWRMPCGN